MARAEDPYTLVTNPAGLSAVPDNQLILNVDTPFHDMCVKPYGYYGWGVYDQTPTEFGDPSTASYARQPLDRVCNSAPVLPVPGLAYDVKVNDDIGLGFGLIAPTVLTGLQYGGADGTIDTPAGGRPTPTRYQLVKQAVTFAWGPSVGVGYRVLPRLRVGLTFQWLGLGIENDAVQTMQAGTSPAHDALVRLRAHDYFIPAVTLGVLATPIDSLDVALTGRIIDDFKGSGDATYTTSTYQTGATSGYIPFTNDPLKLASVKTGVPWVFNAGLRYSKKLPHLESDARGVAKRGDPLGTELFDVELDAGYQLNARSGTSSVTTNAGEILFRKVTGPSDVLKVPDGTQFSVDRHLADALTVRLGGTYNILPKRLGISAGTYYESRGVDPAYANIDSFAFSRIGCGLGVTARVSSWDFALAYGHIFQETLTVATPSFNDPARGFDKRVSASAAGTGGAIVPEQNPPKASQIDATARLEQADATAELVKSAASSSATTSTAAIPRIVNAGVYTASFNIISVSVAHRF